MTPDRTPAPTRTGQRSVDTLSARKGDTRRHIRKGLPRGLAARTAVLSEGQLAKLGEHIAVERDELRTLLFDDSAPLSDLLLWTFMARRQGLQARTVSALRSSGRGRPRRHDNLSKRSRRSLACAPCSVTAASAILASESFARVRYERTLSGPTGPTRFPTFFHAPSRCRGENDRRGGCQSP